MISVNNKLIKKLNIGLIAAIIFCIIVIINLFGKYKAELDKSNEHREDYTAIQLQMDSVEAVDTERMRLKEQELQQISKKLTQSKKELNIADESYTKEKKRYDSLLVKIIDVQNQRNLKYNENYTPEQLDSVLFQLLTK